MKRSISQISQRETIFIQFQNALTFVEKQHPEDLRWIQSRQQLVESFEEFFREYVYVVLASGFRAQTAARLTPLLIDCKGDYEQMLTVFKNKQKCKAIATVFEQFNDKEEDWQLFRSALKEPDDLMQLPRIGPIVKWHLARNIGLCSDVVKPDLHLNRYAIEEHNYESPLKLVEKLSETFDQFTLGEIDFILWVWLSHKRGSDTEKKCCVDKLPIR